MSEKFITSDHHFDHERIITLCNRPFANKDEMTEVMVQKWNERVKPVDHVYHLGDFILSKDEDFIRKLLSRLNGMITLIAGNHDHDPALRIIKEKFQVVSMKTLKVDGFPNITLCHYPMISWDKSHFGTWQLYGHHHGNEKGYGDDPGILPIRKNQQMDCGVDTNNFYPYSLDEIKTKLTSMEKS